MVRSKFNSKLLALVVPISQTLCLAAGPVLAQESKDDEISVEGTSEKQGPKLEFHLGHVYGSSDKLGKWIELSRGSVEGPLSVFLAGPGNAWVMASSAPPAGKPAQVGATRLSSRKSSLHGSSIHEVFPDLPDAKRLFVYFPSESTVFVVHGYYGDEDGKGGSDVEPGQGVTGPADFVISNAQEWQEMASRPALELSGKVAEIRGAVGRVTLRNIDIPEEQEPLYIRQGDGGVIRHLDLKGVVRNIYFQNLRFQMTGWPSQEPNLIAFGTGTFDKLVFDGGSMRHGYGPSQVDFDLKREYPEYARLDHVQTATTSARTHKLSWNDPSMEKGWVEFFNRGEHRVRVGIGSGDVEPAGPGDCCTDDDCPCTARKQCADPGKRVRFCGVDIAEATHFAVRAEGGSSEVNARSEIGLFRYLANAFGASGASKVIDLTFRNMEISDLANGFKGLGRPTKIVIMDNTLDRIYGDTIAVAPRPKGSAYVLRNLISTSFARSGIKEIKNGDAGDPHGDQHQMFGRGDGTIENVFSAGNRSIKREVRPGSRGQGAFYSDNAIVPSYRNVFSISDMFLGGSGRGWTIGDWRFPAADIFLYGATIVDGLTFNNKASVSASILPSSQMYIGRSFASGFPDDPRVFLEDNVSVKGRKAELFFEDYDSASLATSRESIEAALTTQDAYSAIGAVATRDAVDWTTTDPEKVIRWENVPSGVAWGVTNEVAPGTMFECEKRKILNLRSEQRVEPDDGVEWQKLGEDGETIIQDWDSEAGQIEPGQYLKIRFRASDAEHQSVEKGVRINGFHQSKRVVTSATISNPWKLGGAWFTDLAGLPNDTTVVEYEAKFIPRSVASSNDQIFGQVSAGGFRSSGTGAFRMMGVENSAGDSVYSALSRLRLELGVVHVVKVKIDYATGEVTTTVNGEVVATGFMSDLGGGVAQTKRRISFGSRTGRSRGLPEDWEFEYLKIHLTTLGARTLHKEISLEAMGSIANINADPWHQGGVVSLP